MLKEKEKVEGTRRRGGRRNQLLDNLKEKNAYLYLKQVAQECILSRRPLRKVDLSPPSSEEVENDWSLLPLPHIRVYGGWQGIHTKNFPLGMAVCGR